MNDLKPCTCRICEVLQQLDAVQAERDAAQAKLAAVQKLIDTHGIPAKDFYAGVKEALRDV